MRKQGLALLLMSLMLGYGATTSARGGGGGQPGNGGAFDRMSPEGRSNTNAQWSQGATKGQDRAEERRSEEGAEHEKSRAASETGKTPGDRSRQQSHKKKRIHPREKQESTK